MTVPEELADLPAMFAERNQAAVHRFAQETELVPVEHLTVWQLGEANVRVLFRDGRSRVYVDALLALESLLLPWEDELWVKEGVCWEAVGFFDVVTLARGIHGVFPIEIRKLARILGDVLDEEPVPAPARAIWARSWESDPRLTDRDAAADELCRP